ncbi:TetR/AcrR family transcriptional regulator [bacterium SCSIO 12643]|nr:TetR/AcrR family transcriptional regulator [bacterium SCSIO 12643]
MKLQKSIDKKNRIFEATLLLVNSGGFQGASMSKIAKLAEVSPATIYLYFEHKQDLVNQLYLEVQSQYAEIVYSGYESNQPIKKCFQMIWEYVVRFHQEHEKEAAFLWQCEHTNIVEVEYNSDRMKYNQPLLELWKRGQDEGIIKEIPDSILYAYMIYPLTFLMQSKAVFGELKESMLNEAFKAAWDSLRV